MKNKPLKKKSARPKSVKKLRLKLNMSTAQFSQLCGVSQRTVQRWESGQHACSTAFYYFAKEHLTKVKLEVKDV